MKITKSEEITSIANTLFCKCSSLTEIRIPSSVVNIGSNAFADCYGLKNIHVMAIEPPVLASSGVFRNLATTCKIHVPQGSLEAYQSAENWSVYADYMVEMEV